MGKTFQIVGLMGILVLLILALLLLGLKLEELYDEFFKQSTFLVLLGFVVYVVLSWYFIVAREELPQKPHEEAKSLESKKGLLASVFKGEQSFGEWKKQISDWVRQTSEWIEVTAEWSSDADDDMDEMEKQLKALEDDFLRFEAVLIDLQSKAESPFVLRQDHSFQELAAWVGEIHQDLDRLDGFIFPERREQPAKAYGRQRVGLPRKSKAHAGGLFRKRSKLFKRKRTMLRRC